VLTVNEIFHSIQGESTFTGEACVFVRLTACDLRCSWCDTPYTWDWTRFDPAQERSLLDLDAVDALIDAQGTDMLVVTGGEPLLQQRRLLPLLQRRAARGMRIEVETAGTVSPSAELSACVAQFNVSVKLASSGNPVQRRLRPQAIADLRATGRAVWKFVAVEVADLDEIAALVEEHGLNPVYVMPEGTDAATVLARSRELAEPVLARGWHLTSRLHVLLYGNRRGV
jgi:organic radical activating enzyme